jgi:ribose transport system substrate-binding protein
MQFLRLLRVLSLLALVTAVPACQRGPKHDTTVAFVTNNPATFWTIAQRGAEKAAEEFKVNLEFKMPAKGNASEQKQIIEDLLTRGVKGMAVSPNDSQNMANFFKTEVNTKVPLIMQDNDLPDPAARRLYIGTHNYRAGRAVGELVKKAVPKGGKIPIFVGRLDAQNAVERRQGLIDVLLGLDRKEMGEITDFNASNLKMGDYLLVGTRTDDASEQKCLERAQEVLTLNNDMACMVGLWAHNPPAILKAVEGTKQKPVIIGFDEDDATLNAIAKGDIFATVVQDPYQFGYQSIKILAGLARKDDSVLKNFTLDAQNRVFVDHRVITKDNVDAFHKDLKEKTGAK